MDNKILIGGGLVAGAAGIYLMTLNSAGNKIVVETTPQIKNGNISIRVTAKNPTRIRLRISHPFVSLYLSEEKMNLNEPLISSQLIAKNHTIEPNAATTFEVQIGTIKQVIASAATGLFSLLKSALSKDLRLYVKTTMRVNGRIPFDKVDIININEN